MNKYKASLHLHVKGDPRDNIKYTAFEAIEKAAELGFHVIAITCHCKVIFNEEIRKHGQKHGVTVIPSIEAKIEGKDVLILNTDESAEKIKTFKELKEFKKQNPDCLIIAPHPYFFFPVCLKNKLIKYIDLFDAIEWNYFYNKHINPNKKAVRVAQKYNKPVVGTSDVHNLNHFNHTYCIIKAEDQTIPSIIEAIKKNRVDLSTESFSLIKLFHLLWVLYKSVK